ncbi:globin-coupled sensor protein [Sphingomonas astaxanthinifaciens]|uniref:Methyl-accepting chemotaxis protein n=1 Tax=Sphingomonas astaxanthinifaciens DSM 22298 TaxID=1123267 RepID=A0ABQ5Z8B2_9SPHN|nr:globin-coupled sensor protein [Sphingomonas astaxanthinifaciens]GLR48214.1 methyl-accepting chemotaxis protein [Sphingomonas astaxanthinifaciens DSM 22298]
MVKELDERLLFTGFTAEQRARLASAQDRIARHLSPALDRFYATAEKTPHTAAFFRDRTHMGSAKGAQQKHWQRLASGRFDEEYFASARRIGDTHARIGLSPQWYVAAYALVLEELILNLGQEDREKSRFAFGRGPSIDLPLIAAVVKAALIDMELCISNYFEKSESERNAAMTKLGAREAALSSLLETVATTADTVHSGAQEIAQASEDLARRTESNAAALEETVAAIVQMDERIRQTAQSASETVARADETMTTVRSGRSVADEAVQAMGRVSESAKGIDSVIEGLDKIAFQTRVLAMNAAVEAGRAGEAGRGFAVVADLVSALAMRAEEEAKRARDQLTVTQTEVVAAVSAVEKVDDALANISGDVGQVNALIGQIAEDNQAQARAITEINASIASMDRSTQQNAAMVEETSAAARNLLNESSALSAQAASFRTEGGDAAANPVHALQQDAARALTRAA